MRAIFAKLRALFNAAEPEMEDPEKERWEFNWQRSEWADQFKQPEVQEKVYEYWLRFRHLNDILEIAKPDENSYILDVGCGISTILHYLPGFRYGIDPNGERYQEIYRYPPGVEVRKGYGEAIDWPDRMFDLVTCSNCIDHMLNPEKAISEMRRVLKVGGHLALTCEVFARDLGERNVGHPHSMTAERLVALVRPFTLLRHWESPWYGLKNYAEGKGPTDQREHILLLQRDS